MPIGTVNHNRYPSLEGIDGMSKFLKTYSVTPRSKLLKDLKAKHPELGRETLQALCGRLLARQTMADRLKGLSHHGI